VLEVYAFTANVSQAGDIRSLATDASVEECRYFLILAQDLGYGDTQKLSVALEEVSRLLYAYRTAMLTSSTPGS
jgi:hypothetical protein